MPFPPHVKKALDAVEWYKLYQLSPLLSEPDRERHREEARIALMTGLLIEIAELRQDLARHANA